MTRDGLGELIRIYGLSYNTYIQLLDNHVLPQIRESFPGLIVIFMQDQAPAHTHSETKIFHNNQEDLAHIDWTT